jgi:hypothetical protein
MGRFLRLSDEELSRLLAGEAPVGNGALEEVASVLNGLRRTCATSGPDPEVRAAHIAEISEASRILAYKGAPLATPVGKAHGPASLQLSGLPKWRRVLDRTRSIALKAACGTVAASLSMMGLAYAGVDLPGKAAEKALEAATGLDLPNQDPDTKAAPAGDKAVNDEVKAVQGGTLEGCERGQAIAAAARTNRQSDEAKDGDPCTKDASGEARSVTKSKTDKPSKASKAKGSKATGEENSAKGQANKPENPNANGEENSAQGQANKPENPNANGEENSAQGQANKPENPNENGEENSAQGQANKPENPNENGEDNSAQGQANKPKDRP